MSVRLVSDMCLKTFGAYGACVLDKGHAAELCQDASGYVFVGGVMCEYACREPFGCQAPDVHVPGRAAPGGAGRPTYTHFLTD